MPRRRLAFYCQKNLQRGFEFSPNKKCRSKNGIGGFLVGVAGFEPTTFCSQSRRDTGLRYTPKSGLFMNRAANVQLIFCLCKAFGAYLKNIVINWYDAIYTRSPSATEALPF